MQASESGVTLAVSPLRLTARTCQDGFWGGTYITLGAAVVGILAYCASTAKDTYNTVVNECTINGTMAGSTSLAGRALSEDPDPNLIPDLMHGAHYLGLSLGLSVLFGVIWMVLLRFYAKPVVYATLIIKGTLLIALGIYLWRYTKEACGLTEGNCSAAFIPILTIAVGVLYFLWLFCARRRIALTAALLEQSIQVVATHPGLFLVSGLLLCIKVGFLLIGLFSLLFLFLSQVKVTQPSPGFCEYEWLNSHADKLMYCVLTAFLYWSVQFWLCMRYYIVSLTTGVWYYEHQSMAAQEGSLAPKEYTASPVCTSLRTGMTTGFGTVAFGSLVVTLCEMLKSAARRESGNGLLGLMIACCFACVANCIEFLTRFALTYSALTGDGLCASGQTFLDNCTRHGFLKIVVVDYLAAITLNFGAAVFSLVAAAITTLLVQENVLSGSEHDSDRSTVLITIGALAFFVAFFVLVFIASLLLNIVDAAYACIVLDLDNYARTRTFHRPSMATAVLVKVKPDFVVVEQPGGYAVGQMGSVPMGQPVVVSGTGYSYAARSP